MSDPSYNCIVVLGPTASGKTRFACRLASELNGEIISADSRQVYKGLDIGTGKDLNEYIINDQKIPYHLIDIIDVHSQFYLHDFIRELEKSFSDIRSRNKTPIICGGTGLYLEALSKDHSFTRIPEDKQLRSELKLLSKEELLRKLDSYKMNELAGIDRSSIKRLIRGIEIAEYLKTNPLPETKHVHYIPKYIGIRTNKEERNKRIDERLIYRLEHGLIEEVKHLLENGVSEERLEFLGLEYKYVSHHLKGILNKEELFTKLSTAIHQFAKRQMTWFRRMEKQGIEIEWIEPDKFDFSKFKI